MNMGASRHSPDRRLSAGLILVLLFMQVATASYACPNGSPHRGPAESMAMPDCDGSSGAMAMDPQQPLLCQASCNDGAQASALSAAADFAPSGVLLYVLPRAEPEDRRPRSFVHAPLAAGQPPPGWPPAYLFNRILRN